jgi:hypothetical protein
VGHGDKPVFQPSHSVTAVKTAVDTEILAGHSACRWDLEGLTWWRERDINIALSCGFSRYTS